MRLLALALLIASSPAIAQSWEPDSALAALAPLVGAPWESEPFDAGGREVTDVSRYEWAMRGQALRNIHTLSDGSYGGETLIWAEGDSLRFVYVTSGGFTTQGAGFIRVDGALVAEEIVTGNADGIDRVRSVSFVDPEGVLRAVAEFRQNGAWSEGRRSAYRRTPGAQLAPGYAPAPSPGADE